MAKLSKIAPDDTIVKKKNATCPRYCFPSKVAPDDRTVKWKSATRPRYGFHLLAIMAVVCYPFVYGWVGGEANVAFRNRLSESSNDHTSASSEIYLGGTEDYSEKCDLNHDEFQINNREKLLEENENMHLFTFFRPR
jgi:hypothetical protein